MTQISLEPAATIIDRFGGPDVVVEITGADRTRVYRWTQPKERHGTGGLIPQSHITKLLAAAKERGIRLDGNDFLPPATPENLDPLLEQCVPAPQKVAHD